MTTAINDTGATLTVRWPWWMHPGWALLLLTGSMALISVLLPAEAYQQWVVAKYLDSGLALPLFMCIFALFFGIMLSSGARAKGGTAVIKFSPTQIRYLHRAYRVLFFLTVVSYIIWASTALRNDVSLSDLAAVLNRDSGAISRLKSNIRPIGGLTTGTQFGPLAVAIGVILRKLGHLKRRTYWLVIFLGATRALFYAERLALIEVLLPLMLVIALTISRDTKRGKLVGVFPLVAAPVIWGIFAASEYARSWIYYSKFTSIPFTEWVTLRLIGYYTTSFNNSALFVDQHTQASGYPVFTVLGFWNAPGAPDPGTVAGANPFAWWNTVLGLYGNPNFNNTGSFLVTFAELGLFGAVVFWFVFGLVIGTLFSNMTKGSVPALLTYASLFVGILELSRFIYWTQGRAVPLLIALVVIALWFPREKNMQRKLPPAYRHMVQAAPVPPPSPTTS